MLSNYFKAKTKLRDFVEHLECIIESCANKKIIIYGIGSAFLELNKKYKVTEKINIIAIADRDTSKKINNIKTISPNEINNYEFDKILVFTEFAKEITDFLEFELGIKEEKIEVIFEEEFPDERANFIYLEKLDFQEQLNKLEKRLKDKKVAIYGAGVYLRAIKKYYDLSKLNIIAISDKAFSLYEKNETFLGYKAIAPNKLGDMELDCVLVATKLFIEVIEDLSKNIFYGKNVKILPLVKKPFGVLLKEIWR